jgi:hypothetical protein
MTELPPEIMAAIEADVERYRKVRINAALKRQSPKNLQKLAKRHEYEWLRSGRDQIVAWFASGESIKEINSRFKFIGKNRIRQEIESWLLDALNPDGYKEWTNVPRFSEQGWRDKVNELQRP